MRRGLFQQTLCRAVLQVSDMLAQEGPLAGGQAETAFQLSTYCQYTLLGERQIDGPGT